MLRIVSSIGPTEAMHFATWQDDAGNAANSPVAPVTDPVTGLTIPNLDADPRGALVQDNLIFPTPAEFISHKLPHCAVVRPTLDRNAGARAAIKSFTADNLFREPVGTTSSRTVSRSGRNKPTPRNGASASCPGEHLTVLLNDYDFTHREAVTATVPSAKSRGQFRRRLQRAKIDWSY